MTTTTLAEQAAAEVRRTAGGIIAPSAAWELVIVKGVPTVRTKTGRQVWVYARPTNPGLAWAVITPCRTCNTPRVTRVTTSRQAAGAEAERNTPCRGCREKAEARRPCDRCTVHHDPDRLAGGLCPACRDLVAEEQARAERAAALRAELDAAATATYTAVRAALPDTGYCRECGGWLTEFDVTAGAVPGVCFDCA